MTLLGYRDYKWVLAGNLLSWLLINSERKKRGNDTNSSGINMSSLTTAPPRRVGPGVTPQSIRSPSTWIPFRVYSKTKICVWPIVSYTRRRLHGWPKSGACQKETGGLSNKFKTDTRNYRAYLCMNSVFVFSPRTQSITSSKFLLPPNGGDSEAAVAPWERRTMWPGLMTWLINAPQRDDSTYVAVTEGGRFLSNSPIWARSCSRALIWSLEHKWRLPIIWT